jgi:hypothetical protein
MSGPPAAAVGAAIALAAFAVAVAYAVGSIRDGVPQIFTTAYLEQIAEKQSPLLLVVVGEVYDVSAGREFYGRTADGGAESYTGYANGTDNTRAFLTADFENNATDDLSDLTPGQCLGVEHWRLFYVNHSKYTFQGYHVGRYYDEHAQPTAARADYFDCVQRAHDGKRSAQEAMRSVPACRRASPVSTEPKHKIGVWATLLCTDPVRVPRKYKPGLPEAACTCDGMQPGAAACDLACDCACVLPEEAAAYAALDMPDDPDLPQVHAACAESPDSTSCTVRTDSASGT